MSSALAGRFRGMPKWAPVVVAVLGITAIIFALTRREGEARSETGRSRSALPSMAEPSLPLRRDIEPTQPVDQLAVRRSGARPSAGPALDAVLAAFREGLSSSRLEVRTAAERSIFQSWRERVLDDVGDVSGLSLSLRGRSQDGTEGYVAFDSLGRPLGIFRLRKQSDDWKIVAVELPHPDVMNAMSQDDPPGPVVPDDKPPSVIIATVLLESSLDDVSTPRLVRLRNCSSEWVRLERVRLARGPLGDSVRYTFPPSTTLSPGNTISVDCSPKPSGDEEF